MKGLKTKPNYKIWLEKNDDIVFGSGRLELLILIKKHGSISKAAKELSMSYRAAWGRLKVSEKRLGRKLLKVRSGGAQGGGAELTTYANELIDKYQRFLRLADSSIQSAFNKTLKN